MRPNKTAVGIFIMCFQFYSVVGQNASKSFNLYVFKSPNMFSQSTLNYFKEKDIQTAKLMTSSGFNPSGTGIDSSNIVRYMKFFYPDSASSGTCVIDREDSVYYNLRLDKSSKPFDRAMESFIRVVKIMRKTRPNVKIGIYGLPFDVFYPTADIYNEDNKFDELFQSCDFIAPGIYIDFPDKEIGHQRNISYIQHNLNVALQYGYRLKKPVIPFIWEIIHPTNAQYGWMLIPKEEYESYARFMIHYKFLSESIRGFFLWTPSEPSSTYYKIASDSNLISSKSSAIDVRDSVLREYYSGIIKMIGK